KEAQEASSIGSTSLACVAASAVRLTIGLWFCWFGACVACNLCVELKNRKRTKKNSTKSDRHNKKSSKLPRQSGPKNGSGKRIESRRIGNRKSCKRRLGLQMTEAFWTNFNSCKTPIRLLPLSLQLRVLKTPPKSMLRSKVRAVISPV